MASLACVDLPALPLQLLRAQHPEWGSDPVVVVDRDEPQGTILWADERALRYRVRPGLRYAAGLALASHLRAGVVEGAELEREVREAVVLLRDFSPTVEAAGLSTSGVDLAGSAASGRSSAGAVPQVPDLGEPGVFWLDTSGFERLFPDLDAWAGEIEQAFAARSIHATVVVGFDRFSTYALARESSARSFSSGSFNSVGPQRGCVLRSPTPGEERRRADQVPLVRIQIAPKLRGALERLGVDDVGALRRLPAGGLLERFGAEGQRLQRLASGRRNEPLTAVVERAPVVTRFAAEPDEPALDASGLVFLIGQHLEEIRTQLMVRGEALAALRLVIELDRGAPHADRIEPAEPTLDVQQILRLVRLRFERLQFEAPPIGFELETESVRATQEQLELFAETARRDLKAAARCLARLRAELGDDAVVRAKLREGHLPEARFAWEPSTRMVKAQPDLEACPTLVRRIDHRPRAVSSPGGRHPDGWMVAGFAAGPVQQSCGPYVVSGGWWASEREREYYFVETSRGDLLWVFHDGKRRKWFIHGAIE